MADTEAQEPAQRKPGRADRIVQNLAGQVADLSLQLAAAQARGDELQDTVTKLKQQLVEKSADS